MSLDCVQCTCGKLFVSSKELCLHVFVFVKLGCAKTACLPATLDKLKLFCMVQMSILSPLIDLDWASITLQTLKLRCVCLRVCLSVCMCIYLCICVHTCMYINFACVCLPHCTIVHTFVSMDIHQEMRRSPTELLFIFYIHVHDLHAFPPHIRILLHE